MPQGSFDLSPVPAVIATTAMPIIVCRYTPGGEDDEDWYTVLPNVRCLRIDYREGPEPPLARFQYLMDDLLAATMDWPSQFEQLWPIDAVGNYVVMNDDRLVVLTQGPPTNDGSDPKKIVLFDGFAQIPQVDASAQRQEVTFVAQSVAIRLWDDPILGRTQRDADEVGTTDGSQDYFVDLPCRFNPSDTSVGDLGGYVGNSVAEDDFTTDAENPDLGAYPVFIEPYLIEGHSSETNYWFISDVVKYLIAIQPSPEDDAENPYVIYPTFDSLDDVLGNYAPPDNGTLNSSDAQQSNIKIRDYDASNKAVPDVIADMMHYAGFVMTFTISTDDSGNPQTNLKLLRRDALSTQAPKVLYLAPNGASSLDLAANNTTALHLARDCNQVANAWDIETALRQVELTVYLAPGFQPAAGDDSSTNITKWNLSKLTNATDESRRMYRWWVADECGDGHWNANQDSWLTNTTLDFTPVFPNDPDTGETTWVVRYRPGQRTLISKDAAGKPLRAVLELCTNSTSGEPSIQDQPDSRTWTTVAHGWELVDDRLGIRCTVEDPNVWHTGQQTSTGGAAAVPTIRAVTWSASPDETNNHAILFRLTTVIDADIRINATADKRLASPTKFTRRRSADGKDHFQLCMIAPNSLYYSTQKDMNGDSGDGTNPLIVRDDTKAATTHAEQLRAAHEFPTLAGSATLPFLTDYYQIGDRVKIIEGRGADLAINIGADQGETPSYPWIAAFAWDFQGNKQQTILQFSDRRAEPQGF